MKKLLNILPLLLLCSCITTQPTIPPEPELAVKKETVKLAAEKNTEVISLKTPEKLPLKKPVVIIKTSKGDITVELDVEKAPVTVKNFLNYVDKKFYTGTVFHRVIPNFMIQGGGFAKKMKRKMTDDPIKNEAYNGLSNTRGTVAMARTNRVDSATSQFFINVRDNKNLDHRDHSAPNFGYCVFGNVVDGMEVVDKIRKVKTGTSGYFKDVPVEEVMIEEVVRVKK